MTAAISEIIVTADNPEWLTSFTRQLVEERWCACAQHINPVRSIYRWEGAVQDDAEIRVALHTRTALVPGLIDRIKQNHPYDVPCILAFSVEDANPAYVAWVEAETASVA
ncbi:MAG: divalent-cation tolerance protein CutA [Acidimicrobiaceae bacterium]|nr:divalent-cation tolerance protein CutA [Acidimicrobiaceae bacterium]